MEKDLKNENRGKRNKKSKLKSSLKSKTNNKNSETFFSNDGSLDRDHESKKSKSRGMIGLALKTNPNNTKRGTSTQHQSSSNVFQNQGSATMNISLSNHRLINSMSHTTKQNKDKVVDSPYLGKTQTPDQAEKRLKTSTSGLGMAGQQIVSGT